jgi:hypothetical protein
MGLLVVGVSGTLLQVVEDGGSRIKKDGELIDSSDDSLWLCCDWDSAVMTTWDMQITSLSKQRHTAKRRKYD